MSGGGGGSEDHPSVQSVCAARGIIMSDFSKLDVCIRVSAGYVSLAILIRIYLLLLRCCCCTVWLLLCLLLLRCCCCTVWLLLCLAVEPVACLIVGPA